jgi:Subtilase family
MIGRRFSGRSKHPDMTPGPVGVFLKGVAVAMFLLVAVPGFAPAAEAPRRITVLVQPGKADQVAAQLSRGALRVVRRQGRRLEVVASPARAAAFADLPGVASAGESTTSFADEVVGEGVQRSGAAPMIEIGNGGRGLTIAVVDLGFGASLAARQAAKELPPSSRLELVSFDPVKGIAGANAYGNATNHGELVAQTVYDFAPNARYIFVSYHTEADFLAATDWLAKRRPDIVVHSNSFIEGPFDGTGPEAQAVDRAAAAGILWFNSAGNYAELHWAGPWADVDGDTVLDLGAGGVFERQAGAPITFAVSWSAPPGEPPTDLDLILESQLPDGSWAAVRSSTDSQAAGARPSERFVGYVPQAQGIFRVRVVHVSGPEPVGTITLFSREVPLAQLGGSSVSSVPTPGDAAGSISVGAVDWRGNTLKSYSSQGPTLDGRAKPDVVAPTNTRVLGPSGPRSVGGTSNAAPNAAGVAAVLLAAQRVAKIPFSYDVVRATLESTALDLGEPGPDPAFGQGRVRAEVDPPELALVSPLPGAAVKGSVRMQPLVTDDSGVAQWSVKIDGSPVATRRLPVGSVVVNTRTLGDGLHTVEVGARDMPGNAGQGIYTIEVDNTRPDLLFRRVEVGTRRTPVADERAPAPTPGTKPSPRRVTLVVSAEDGGRRPMRLDLRVTDSKRRTVGRRSFATRSTLTRRIVLGRLEPGRYRAAIELTDAAGNVRKAGRVIVVR